MKKFQQFDHWVKQQGWKRHLCFFGGIILYEIFLGALIPLIRNHSAMHTPLTCYGAIFVTLLFLSVWPIFCYRKSATTKKPGQ